MRQCVLVSSHLLLKCRRKIMNQTEKVIRQSTVAEWNANDTCAAEMHVEWVRMFQASIQPFAAKGVYSNFLGDEGKEQVRASYGVNYERLVALKNRYDPTNFFRFNQNIEPAV